MKDIDTGQVKKVLIVDDEPHILRVLKMKLENAGYEVVTAVNGMEALEKFVREKPAVVITDINMPLIDGQELCVMMMNHKREKPFSVIAITSSLDNAIHMWARETENIHFVEKPFSPRHILELVSQIFSMLQGASVKA